MEKVGCSWLYVGMSEKEKKRNMNLFSIYIFPRISFDDSDFRMLLHMLCHCLGLVQPTLLTILILQF